MTEKIREDLKNFYRVSELTKCSDKLAEAVDAVRTAERALEEAMSKMISAGEVTPAVAEDFEEVFQDLSAVRHIVTTQKNKHVDRVLRNVAFEVEMALGVDKL